MALLENASLLLERSFDKDGINALEAHQNILIANFGNDGYCAHLAAQFPDKQFTAFTYNFATYSSLSDSIANLEVICDYQLVTQKQFDCVVIYFPKSKPEFEYMINNMFNHVKSGTLVYVTGDNKGGVKSCEKPLVRFCSKPKKIDAAKHCALYLTTINEPSKSFNPQDWYKQYNIQINNIELKVYTLPGVFSHGNLDDGTKLLLEGLGDKPRGKVLDFGCGAGLIGAYLAKQNPQLKVTGVDVSSLAVESTKTTFKANGIDGKAVLSDGLSKVEGKFDQVYSNPPFHTGVKTNYAITELFINTVKQYLEINGDLTIVANSFLKYQPLLEQQFGGFEVLCGNKRFNVYHAKKA